MLMIFAAAAGPSASDPWYMHGAMRYMIDGGPFMWPILFMGVLAAAVMIERYRTLRMLDTDTRELRRQVADLLQQDRVEDALALCKRSTGPVPAVLSVGLRKYLLMKQLDHDPAKTEEQVVKAMDDYGIHIVAALEKHLPILSTISSIAPMVGSVGTVLGMVVLFGDIVTRFGTENIVVAAAGGIRVKLLCTLFGLLIGIQAFVGYNYFVNVINRYVLEVEDSATDLIEAVTLQTAIREKAAATAAAAAAVSRPEGVLKQ